MTDLHELARPHLEAAARFTPSLADLQKRATERRRRRHVVTSIALGGAAVVLSVGMFVSSNRPSQVHTAAEGSVNSHPALSIERIEARGGANGTSEVTVAFDAPLPTGEIHITNTVESIDPDLLVAAVQDSRQGAVKVSATTHWFPETPQGSGSVDLLIPAAWLLGDRPEIPAITTLDPPPDKIVTCGPYKGHVQISVWGAAPASTETLDVTLSADRTQIIVRVIPKHSECAASGEPTVTVPDVVGKTLRHAIDQITDRGLVVVGRGVPDGDPSLDTSIVRAQEPPAGEVVPQGACIGLRTEPDEA